MVLAIGSVYYLPVGGTQAVFWFGLVVCTFAAFIIGLVIGRGQR
jgi:predicted cation transporter